MAAYLAVSGMVLGAPESKLTKEDRRSETPELKWSMSGSGEVKLPKKSDPQKQATVKTKDGKGQDVEVKVSPLQITTFRGTATYIAELPQRVRQKPTFVNFLLSATPGTTPQDGSIFNIDGAIFSFVEVPTSANQMPKARLMVQDVKPDGSILWRTVNWTVTMDAEAMTVSPPMGVRIDYANKTWALYHYDLIIAEGLPLFVSAKKPTITVTPGRVVTDIALLKELRISGIPRSRPQNLAVPLKNGRIDIETAVKENDPRLKLGTVTKQSKIAR